MKYVLDFATYGLLCIVKWRTGFVQEPDKLIYRYEINAYFSACAAKNPVY